MKKIYNFYKRLRLENQNSVRNNPIWLKLMLPLIGFLALLWFLIRVIPKPSRAAYPCQRIAFPLASGFVLWLAGLFGSVVFIRKAQKYRRRYFLASLCIAAAALCLWFSLSTSFNQTALADDHLPNQPIGVAKGIHPGRVVWIHDPNATDWNGAGDGYSWQPANTPQKFVDAMVSRGLRELAGQSDDSAAWQSIFQHFNDNHGKGPVGYIPGEKITIKVNLVTCGLGVGSVNPATYQKTSYLDKSDTSPEIIIAVLRQLIDIAGVNPSDIAVGDTTAYFPAQWWDLCRAEFPDVVYFDAVGQQGRVKNTPSAVRQHWSHGQDPNSFTPDYIPSLYAQADYLINLAVLKGHSAGISLCGKNHYGSYIRTPDAAGFYSLHESLAGLFNTADAQYRAQTDIMGHPDMGGKTLLYMLDGLYSGYPWRADPHKFQTPPFNNDWPSSIFLSQDPVAIDSVGLDILWQEWPSVVRVGGVQDYLHEAALADDPPSSTFYDPDNDGQRLQSLGVHEHWNNPTDRQYSRNLGTGNGIELRYFRLRHLPADLNSDDWIGMEDFMLFSQQWLWTGTPGLILEDITEDGSVDFHDFNILSENWRN